MSEIERKLITKEKYLELQQELEKFHKQREELNEAWRMAVGEGDDRETDALSVTLQLLESVERDILRITETIRIVDIARPNTEKGIGIGVKLLVKIADEERTLTLVDPIEASPLEDKISIEAPLGEQLYKMEVGETRSILLPTGGEVVVSILQILA